MHERRHDIQDLVGVNPVEVQVLSSALIDPNDLRCHGASRFFTRFGHILVNFLSFWASGGNGYPGEKVAGNFCAKYPKGRLRQKVPATFSPRR